MSCVTMTYDTKWSGNIIKTLEINDLSEITCYFANLVFIFADCRNLKIKLMIIYIYIAILESIASYRDFARVTTTHICFLYQKSF